MTAFASQADRRTFILANTALIRPPHVPEIALHLAAEMFPIWRLSEDELSARGVAPPYWAFAWAGGQALARYILDHRSEFAARTVLDIGAGSGIEAIAAALAGASVTAADIDPYAAEAMALNVAAAGVSITVTTDDPLTRAHETDIILIGDLFYEPALAATVLNWAGEHSRRGIRVLVGDPGRAYLPRMALTRLATYHVSVSRELEDNEVRATSVYELTSERAI